MEDKMIHRSHCHATKKNEKQQTPVVPIPIKQGVCVDYCENIIYMPKILRYDVKVRLYTGFSSAVIITKLLSIAGNLTVIGKDHERIFRINTLRIGMVERLLRDNFCLSETII